MEWGITLNSLAEIVVSRKTLSKYFCLAEIAETADGIILVSLRPLKPQNNKYGLAIIAEIAERYDGESGLLSDSRCYI